MEVQALHPVEVQEGHGWTEGWEQDAVVFLEVCDGSLGLGADREGLGQLLRARDAQLFQAGHRQQAVRFRSRHTH